MDNFEHVLGASDWLGEIVREALHSCLLVTSRSVLKMQGEWVRYVDGLHYHEVNFDKDGRLGGSAIQLFADRAWRLNGDFSLQDDGEHVVRICQLVEGMPLALELAAGWIDTLTCGEIVTEIERDLSILATDTRDMPDRHRSMRAVLDHSWQRLDAVERAVFRKLSVFRGGFEREAAEQVAGATLRLLGDLVRRSWLRMSGGRYDIQEVLRQYGADQLEAAGEVEPTRDAHSRYYAAFMAHREVDIKGRRQIGALDEIQQDFENIRIAWWWAVDHHRFDDIGRMIESFYLYFYMRGTQTDYKLIYRAFDQIGSFLEAISHPLWARFAVRCGEDGFSEKRTKKAVELAQKHDDQATAATGIQVLAFIAARINQSYNEAIDLYKTCLRYYQDVGDRFREADVYCQLQLCYESVGNWQSAQESGHRSLTFCREIGDRQRAAQVLDHLGYAASCMGEHMSARQFHEESLEIHTALQDMEGIIQDTVALGFHHWLHGEWERTSSLLRSATNNMSYARWKDSDKDLQIMLGLIQCMKEDYREGWRLVEQGYTKLSARDLTQFAGNLGIAIATVGLDDDQTAEAHLIEILEYALQTGTQGLMTRCLPVAAVIIAHNGDKQRAVELLGLAFTHPKSATGWMVNWPLLTRFRADLEAELGAAAYDAAWERGAKLDLEATAADLLHTFSGDGRTRQQAANANLADPLTSRELEVLALLAKGYSNRQIAEALVISVGTVKGYTSIIYQKLNANNRTDAGNKSHDLGLL